MKPNDSAKACLISPTTYALRPLAAAEVGIKLSTDEQELARQLQLERWPVCHSLCFNLQRMHGCVELTRAQIEQVIQAGSSLPLLRCLHIIGNPLLTNIKGSAEALLMSVLSRHASVLTLHANMVEMPLELPNLQHLVLHLVPFQYVQSPRKQFEALFPCMSMLKNLKSLYIRSATIGSSSTNPKVSASMDLRECAHLQHVALRNIGVRGLVALPAGCHLHLFDEPYLGRSVTPSLADLVSGLTLRHRLSQKLSPFAGLLGHAPRMANLKQLRLTTCKNLLGCCSPQNLLDIRIEQGMAPKLEVLELYVYCSMSFSVDLALPLRLLTVITSGRLELSLRSAPTTCHVPKDTLKQVYIQSGVPLSSAYEGLLPKYFSRELWPQMRLTKSYGARPNGWTLQMPASFSPSNLQECCCRACPECLVRAGVPILCDKAWTSDGFDRYLRPHYKRGC